MKISILCWNLSNNALGRSWLLAQVLRRHYTVEIVGPLFSDSPLWPPLACRTDIAVKNIPVRSCRDLKSLYRALDGDVIYANKTLFSSLGLALWKKIRTKKPVVLDIDDWDLGFALYKLARQSPRGLVKTFGRWFLDMPRFYQSDKICSLYFFEKLAHFADAITVSNSFLQKKFGGTIVPHVRDTDILNPAAFDSRTLRAEYGIAEDLKIAGFIGTPRPFKGVEDLLNAAARAKSPSLAVMIVGMDANDTYCRKIEEMGRSLLGSRFISFGAEPFESMPRFLALCDMAVIPQRKTLATKGQIPAKLFDAMAMAKPIVATDVNDIGQILSGCGSVVPPGNIDQLTLAIDFIISNPDTAIQFGRAARQRCVERYSFGALEPTLAGVFERFNG